MAGRTMAVAGPNLLLIITDPKPRVVRRSRTTCLADRNSASRAFEEAVAIALVGPSSSRFTAGVSGRRECEERSGKDSQSFEGGELHFDAVRNRNVNCCSDEVERSVSDNAEVRTLSVGWCCHFGIDGL